MTRRILTAMGLCALLAIGPAFAIADDVPTDGAEPIMAPSYADAWWGAAGAMICGAGIGLARFYPVVGMNPYVLAGTIAGCVIAAIDVMTS